mmetsp:Transcript_13217/g.24744  ORF Transcript_13217/g.24744 Transcript_13217/m.24744 type:complete len:326 (-) Transcript_13217:555-1532(-)
MRSNSEPRTKKSELDESTRSLRPRPYQNSPKPYQTSPKSTPSAGQIRKTEDLTKKAIAESVSEAEDKLFKETQQMLSVASKNAYNGLRHKVLAYTDYKCAKSGLKINARKNTPAESDFKVTRSRASRQPSPGLKSNSGSFTQDSVKDDDKELQAALNRYSGSVTETIVKGLTEQQAEHIRKEVELRFNRTIEVLKVELQEMVTEIGSMMQSRLEKEIEQRIVEIVNVNEAAKEKKKHAFGHDKLAKTMKPLSQKEKNLLALDLTKLKQQVSFEDSDLKPEDLEESIGKQEVKVKGSTKSLQHKYTKRVAGEPRRSKVSKHLLEFL